MATTPITPTTPVAGATQSSINPGARVSGNPYKIDARYRFRKNQAIFRGIFYTSIRPGALITFQYVYWKHDPFPLVLSTGLWPSGKMAGINLHYLTFLYIRYMLNQFCGKNFVYKQISGNLFVKNSFRCYKKDGIRNIRLMDAEFLITSLGQMRSFNPTEVAAMRQWVKEQLARKMNQPMTSQYLDKEASGVHGQYTDIINPNTQGDRYKGYGVPQDFGFQDKRQTYDKPDIAPTI